MLPYFLLLLISTIAPLLIYHAKGVISVGDYEYIAKKRSRATVILFFIGLFVLLSLRDLSVGSDLGEYEKIFERCYGTPFEFLSEMRWELGYTVYNKLISMIARDYRLLLVITALISLLPLCILYSKENKYGLLMIILFINMPCFLIMFSGLRQAIAIAIGAIAYMAIEKKKHITGLLLIILAASFHISAAILVLLYPAYFIKIKTKHLLFIIPILVGIYAFRTQIFTFMLGFLPSQYIYFYGELQQTGAFGMMLLFLLFSVFAFVMLDENSMSRRDYFMRNILLIATVCQFFVPIHGLVQRASYYFMIFIPIALASVVRSPKRFLKNISNYAVLVMTCFFAVYFFYHAAFSTDNLLNVFPYKFMKW